MFILEDETVCAYILCSNTQHMHGTYVLSFDKIFQRISLAGSATCRIVAQPIPPLPPREADLRLMFSVGETWEVPVCAARRLVTYLGTYKYVHGPLPRTCSYTAWNITSWEVEIHRPETWSCWLLEEVVDRLLADYRGSISAEDHTRR